MPGGCATTFSRKDLTIEVGLHEMDGWEEGSQKHRILQALDIPVEWLPPTHEGPAITGTISAAAAQATGLQAGTPVIGGGGDQAAGAVGVGAVQPGVVGLVLGTSGVVFAPTGAPLVEPEGRLQAHCHAAPGRWHLMGVMLSAAGSLRWFRDAFAPDQSFD